jgi:hypothetical protein
LIPFRVNPFRVNPSPKMWRGGISKIRRTGGEVKKQ